MRADSDLENVLIQCITQNKESVYRLAYSYVRNSADALDIVQDSIQKAFVSLHKLKNSTSLKSWFYRIVVNAALDCLRKQKKVQIVDDQTLESQMQVIHDTYPDLDLSKAMEELPLIYRAVIILRYFEDLKIEEIAEVLKENVNTIKTRLYQALKMLRVHMSDEMLKEVD